jgi:ATP-dependent Lon protease
VTEYLGVPRFRSSMAEEKNEIGVATGLAWTEVGGEILTIEATLMPGKGRLTLTGKLGDVMQESAQAAMSYVRSKATSSTSRRTSTGRPTSTSTFPRGDPEGRPVGRASRWRPSLISALGRIPIRKEVAMTGEITLRGKVLPIGGVKEKILAAHRSGLKTIIVPRENEKDLADIPKNVLDTLNVYMVESMDEVLKIALAEPLAARIPAAAPAEPEISRRHDSPTEDCC